MTRLRRRISRMIRSSDFCPDLLPMDVWKDIVGERLVHAPLDEIGCGVHPCSTQVVDDRVRLSVLGKLERLIDETEAAP